MLVALSLISISCAKSKTSFVPTNVEVPGAPILVVPSDVNLAVQCPNLSGAHLIINFLRVNGVVNVVVSDSKNGKYCTLSLDANGNLY